MITNDASSQTIPELCAGGSVTVTWNISDLCENPTFDAIFTLIPDTDPPIISCPDDVEFCEVPNENYTIPEITVTDNCSSTITSFEISGATIRSGTGVDASGR